MRAVLRADRGCDELAHALEIAGLHVERVAAVDDAQQCLAGDEAAVVDPTLLTRAAPALAAVPDLPSVPDEPKCTEGRAAVEESLEAICFARLGGLFARLGDERLPHLYETVMREAERALLRQAIERASTVAEAAELLGIHRNTLVRRLEELGLRKRPARKSRGGRR